MIIDTIYNLVTYFLQQTVLRLGMDLPGISIDTFSYYLNTFSDSIGGILYVINKFFPWDLMIQAFLGIMGLEILLFTIRMAVTGWNMVRGSGAKV